MIDFPAIAAHLLPDALTLLREWLPAGKLAGREYKIGSLSGEPGESLSINIDNGKWADFATGKGGIDLLALYAAIHGLSQAEAAKQLSNGHAATIEDAYVIGHECHPIPKHKHGKPSGVWEYKNADYKTLAYICRFDVLNGGKEFSPLTAWQDAQGNIKWKWKKWIGPNPIYGADKLSANPAAKALIVEGEKTADAAQKLLPEWIVITWPGGSGAVKQCDWSALNSRYCWIWPDNDEPGIKAAQQLKKILPHLQVVQIPADLPQAWDLGDAPEGFDPLPYLKAQQIIKQLTLKEREKAGETKAQRDSLSAPPLPLVKGSSNNTCVTINGFEYEGVAQKSIQNLLVLTETDKDIKDCLIYNIFADDVFFVKCPPWENPETFIPHPLREDEILNYRAWVDTRGLVAGKNDAGDVLVSIARRNTVNPPKEYFETLKWKGKPRIDTWLTYYLGAEDQNADYLRHVGSKWLIAAVKRVYEPGCKFDNVLILEGEQYIGKSTALERLATINGMRYFTDESVEFKNKDSLIKLQGKLIFEMAELASFRKAETDEIKGFVRRSVDEYRPPYGRKSQSRPRMFVIAGTVNPTAGYLTDPTGNTRYWPVKCGKSIDLIGLTDDREQIWAEAVYRYKQGERVWLEGEEHKLACIEQDERMIEDLMADKIISKAEMLISEAWTKDFYLSDLIGKLDIPTVNQDGKMRLRVTDCLVSNGYTEYMPRIAGKQRRKWKHKEAMTESAEP